VSGGEYYVEVSSTDGAGAEQVVVATIAVQQAPGGGTAVVAMPNVMRGFDARTVFRTDPPSDMTLRVRIYALSGELVAATEGISGGIGWSPGYYTASGLYLAVIEPRAQDGRVTPRRVLKLLLLR